jgi:hypothetical protein
VKLPGWMRAEYLLPIACLAAAACVAAAEFSTIFEYNQGTSGEPLQIDKASDRHYYALLVLAVFAVVALAVAVITGSRPAAAAVGIAGGISLLIFLLVDLPDMNVEGPLSEPFFTTSKAEPANGFWLEMVGTLSLALAGGALATLSSQQLRALVPSSWKGGEAPERERRSGARPAPAQAAQRRARKDAAKGDEKPKPAPGAAADEKPKPAASRTEQLRQRAG